MDFSRLIFSSSPSSVPCVFIFSVQIVFTNVFRLENENTLIFE